MKNTIQAAVATLLAASAGQAQQAVQWKVSNGGNGHWYQGLANAVTRQDAEALGSRAGGHLATITSAQENQFLAAQNLPSNGGTVSYWTGGVRASAGSGPWSWSTNEPWSYSNFDASEPNGCCGADVRFTTFRTHVGHEGRWDDTSYENPQFTLIEWDADCNNDGIVDYGQCQDGTLPDYNGNNIPDCCEAGTPCTANLIVNGSFELGVVQPCGWICIGVGDNRLEGWEVTLNSVDRERTEPGGCNENWFASHGNYSVDMNGCSVGGVIRQHVATEVGRRYLLSFDMSLNPTIVSVGLLRVRAGPISQDFEYLRKPTNPQPNERREMAFVASSVLTTIEFESLNREYPAQWNGPVVDSVRLAPSDPALPTCVDADFFRDFTVNGADLGILLSQWGPNTPLTVSDLNGDGGVDGADLGLFLSFWGACP